MSPSEVMAILTEHDAIRRGHFRLSSGRHSDLYVQCAQVCQWPGVIERLGAELARRFAPVEPTVVCGPAMGGVIVAHEVARALGVRMAFTERVDGAMQLRRGFAFDAADRVLVVEDVVTTGRSPREAMDVVTSTGASVVGVAAIVDRSRGLDLGVRFEPLVAVDAEAWDPDECPLCLSGLEASTPGSRYAGR